MLEVTQDGPKTHDVTVTFYIFKHLFMQFSVFSCWKSTLGSRQMTFLFHSHRYFTAYHSFLNHRTLCNNTVQDWKQSLIWFLFFTAGCFFKTIGSISWGDQTGLDLFFVLFVFLAYRCWGPWHTHTHTLFPSECDWKTSPDPIRLVPSHSDWREGMIISYVIILIIVLLR